MTSFIFKRVFKEYAKNNFGSEDPYFEYIPATRIDGTPNGKVKRVKKALPPGISEHDAQVLTKMKRRAYRLDSGLFSLCGTRVGWDGVIGLFPIVGDVAGLLLSLMVIQTAKQVEGGLPFSLKIKMYIMALIDFVLGFIPFIGDAADAVFKANNRNTVAFEQHLREKGKKNLRKSGLPVPDLDPSNPDDYDRIDASARPGYSSRQPSREEPMMSAGRTQNNQRSDTRRGAQQPTPPAPARVHDDRRGGASGGWLGRFGKKNQPADVETGIADNNAPPMRQASRR
ncbi:hypothetical protein SLS62_004594 [Diatrype stigma]|uniref:PH domain-containing protein n=1 Tax=Diatrype stigma TaxID=117547 RepID=A0AAN9UQN9_9PEZI